MMIRIGKVLRKMSTALLVYRYVFIYNELAMCIFSIILELCNDSQGGDNYKEGKGDD